MNTPRLLHLGPAIALLCLFTLPAHAVTIVEDFDQYTASSTPVTGLTAVPGFGTTGGGWLEGWRSATTSVNASASVLNTTPVNSGGNYFSGTLAANSSTGTNDAISLGKAYDVTGNSLASATALYVNFAFRVDSIASATMRYDLFDNQTRGTGAVNGSWQVRTVNGFWNILNGSTVTATTLAFTAGTTYSFAIVSHPTTFTWDYTISDGSTSVSATGLNFRVASFTVDATAGSVGGRWFTVAATETTDTSGQSTTFSLDNVSIGTSAIPEPSTCALLVGAASLGLVLIGRHRRR